MLEVKETKDAILFEPVAGYTIQLAIQEAIQLAQKNNKPVKLNINDFIMDINKKSDFMKTMKLYETLLKKRYEEIQR